TGGVEPVGDAGVAGRDHRAHPAVGVDVQLVRIQRRLAGDVVQGGAEGVPDLDVPVAGLGHVAFQDDRLVGGDVEQVEEIDLHHQPAVGGLVVKDQFL